MGLELSRQANLPLNLDSRYLEYKEGWTNSLVSENILNRSELGKSTLDYFILKKAVDFFKEYLSSKSEWTDVSPKILEIFAGNGVASKIFYDGLKEIFPDTQIKSTDIQNLSQYLSPLSNPVEFGLNSVETIEKYSDQNYNILLMISPPPASSESKSAYGDYFAIRKWSELTNGRLIVFVGELGASDGSEGLYKFMVENNINWRLDFRKMISRNKDVFGLPAEKEIFIFCRK